MIAAHAANRIWIDANVERWRRYRRALSDPGRCQRRILQRCLETNAESEFGRRHRFASIGTVDAFRRRVPLSSYDDYRPWVDGIRRGRHHVLTREPVRRLVPSGGSAGPCKLIPFTDSLLAEFNRAIGPWVVELYRRRPDLEDGPAYWSISPAQPADDETSSAVPVGFEDDAAYIGGHLRSLIERSLAVPVAARAVEDIEAFRYVTLRWLLAHHDLRLISVWHPSFLTLLIEPLPVFWDRLLDDVRHGTLQTPVPLRPSLHAALARGLEPDPRRADKLERSGPREPRRIWPRLGVISCWADGHAARAAAEVQRMFPGVALQPKGLLATEAFVTLPFDESRPVAVRSHFYEFLDDDGRSHLVDELRAGGEYTVAVTTGGGLYRYRLGDRVRVDGFVASTPGLRFVGREDRVSDRFGEKLGDAFVAMVLEDLLKPLAPNVSFAMLAPDEHGPKLGYTLFLETRFEPPADLADRLDRRLSDSYHYRYCVRLGQLAPARLFRVRRHAYRSYVEAQRERGQRIGDIKPTALSTATGWSSRFDGSYLDGNRREWRPTSTIASTAGHP
jgi:hypothetical protein